MNEWMLAPRHGHSRVEAGGGCVWGTWDRMPEYRFTLFPTLALLSPSE